MRGSAWISHSLADSLGAHVCVSRLFSIAESYLVDPASNHMLVSEINPCMSNFTLFHV